MNHEILEIRETELIADYVKNKKLKR